MSHGTDSHCHNLLCDLLAQQPSVSLNPHITKSLLPKGWRISSPVSDSGVALLIPVASHGAFSSHHVTESQEGLRLPERDTLSSVSGDTSPSSPSKSDHDTEDASCHHQATKKTLHEKDGANCPKSLRTSSSFMVQGGKIKQKFVDLGAPLRWNPNKGKKWKQKEASRFSAGSRLFRSKLENWKAKPPPAAQASPRSPCMPFSWFTESRKGSYSFRNLPSVPSPLPPSPETLISDKIGSKVDNRTKRADKKAPIPISSQFLEGLLNLCVHPGSQEPVC